MISIFIPEETKTNHQTENEQIERNKRESNKTDTVKSIPLETNGTAT